MSAPRVRLEDIARCDQCGQPILPTADGLACGCHGLAGAAVAALLAACEAVPEPWSVLELLDLIEEIRARAEKGA
jgi:hypothetical protein